jgi:signal transduction histidine kinase
MLDNMVWLKQFMTI